MPEKRYVYIWSFEVVPENVAEFERVYGPDGEWGKLFTGASGYRSTALLRDRERPGRYLTVDTWESAAAFESFRAANAAAFEALDRACERFTSKESLVGQFEQAGWSTALGPMPPSAARRETTSNDGDE